MISINLTDLPSDPSSSSGKRMADPGEMAAETQKSNSARGGMPSASVTAPVRGTEVDSDIELNDITFETGSDVTGNTRMPLPNVVDCGS